jgi:hypothetical protein
MTFGELKDRLVQEAVEANRTTVRTFTESAQFRQSVAGSDLPDESLLEWESRHIPNTQVVTVFPTAFDAYKRFGRAVTDTGLAALFKDPVQLLQGLLDLALLLRDLRRLGKNLQSVEATTVFYAVKRTGREGLLRHDLVACVSESLYEDPGVGRRPFVAKEQIGQIIGDLVSMGVLCEDGDRVTVQSDYLD